MDAYFNGDDLIFDVGSAWSFLHSLVPMKFPVDAFAHEVSSRCNAFISGFRIVIVHRLPLRKAHLKVPMVRFPVSADSG